MKFVIINGPNLNLLGKREKGLYGSVSFDAFFNTLVEAFPQHDISHFQSNHEGAIIDMIHEAGYSADGIILNAGAYTHTSIAIRDAIAAVNTDVVEVHITDIYRREPFRWHSYISDVCSYHIIGKGLEGYREALEYFILRES